MINLIFSSWHFTVCSVFTPQWNSNHPLQAGNLLGRYLLNTRTKTVSPVTLLLLMIMNELAELSLSLLMTCQDFFFLFYRQKNCLLSCNQIHLSLLPGSGAGDLLSDRVWTLLLILQTNVASPIHTGRYTVIPLLFKHCVPFSLIYTQKPDHQLSLFLLYLKNNYFTEWWLLVFKLKGSCSVGSNKQTLSRFKKKIKGRMIRHYDKLSVCCPLEVYFHGTVALLSFIRYSDCLLPSN